MPKLCSLVMAILTASHVAPAEAQPAPTSGEDGIASHWNEKVLEASHLRTNGALDDALKGFEAALEMARSLGEESSYFGLTLNRIGSVYLDQGKYHQAEMALSRALPNLEHSFGPEHIEVANCLAALGTCYRSMGRYVESESASSRVLAIVQKAGDSANIAVALYAMGLLYFETVRHAQAITALQEALRLVEQQRNPPAGALANVLMYLGNAYLQQSRFQEGEPILRRAWRAAIRAYGPGTRQVAYVECGLALLDSARGQLRSAEARLRRALPILEATLGRDHPDVAAILVDLAETVRHQGRYAEAQALAERGVKAMAALGDGPIVVGEALATLANTISSQGGYARAEPLFRRALTIFLRTVGENDRRTASALTCLAITRAKQGDYVEADVLIQRALRIEQNVGGPDGLLRGITLIEYAKVLRHSGQKRHATEMEKEAHALFARSRKASAKATVDVSELK
jgi:tetratricopeptide (TPR) repeat protein